MSISSKRHASIGFKVSVFLIAALGVIGVAGFLAGLVCCFVSMSDNPRVSTRARFPLGDLQTVAVDSSGNVYCGIAFYSRIQAYSPEGDFIRGWFIDTGGGAMQMKIDGEDNIHVGTVRGSKHYIFSTEGKLLSAEDDAKAFKEFGTVVAVDTDRNTYEILNGVILPRVAKTDVNGEKSVVVSDPFFLWFINGPLPAWLWIGVAMLLGRGLSLLKKRNWI